MREGVGDATQGKVWSRGRPGTCSQGGAERGVREVWRSHAEISSAYQARVYESPVKKVIPLAKMPVHTGFYSFLIFFKAILNAF